MNENITSDQQLALLTTALNSLVIELRHARESRVHPLWHTAVVAVATITMFVGLQLAHGAVLP